MKISVFGLGYVGTVTCAIMSQNNYVLGVDINETKVNMIEGAESPIIEKDVEALIKKGVEFGNLKATTNTRKAIFETDISVICVGTPSNDDGSHNLDFLYNALEEIVESIKEKDRYHLIIIRSTIPPGTADEIYEKYIKGIKAGLCFNPEFLREGSAVSDYKYPPFIIVASSDLNGVELMKEFYNDIDAEFIEVEFKEAEIIKVLCNVFHALKVTFGNEVGRFCEAYGIDGKRVMGLLCKDTKLNISEKYLTPGFAFGGSCLPKDLRSLEYLSRMKSINLPLINSINISNENHISAAIKKIESFGTKKIGFIGLSFKAGTDDLRESPYVKLVEFFIGKGFDIKILDKDVSLAKLIGANKAYIENEINHIGSLLVKDISELNDRELIVLNRDIPYDFQNKNIVELK